MQTAHRSLARRLNEALARQGLTIEDQAEILGLARDSWVQYLHGHARPSVERVGLWLQHAHGMGWDIGVILGSQPPVLLISKKVVDAE